MCLPGILCVYYEMAQHQAREQMEKKLEKEQLVQLQIPVNDLHWYKPAKEIVLDGALFDIKTMRIENGIAHISGLYDKQETKIKQQLRALQQKKDKDQGAGRLAFKWTSQTLFLELQELHCSIPDILMQQKFPGTTTHYPTVYADIVVPPPEV